MKKKILIIDDNADSRELLSRSLKELGEIETAADMTPAIGMLKTGGWDLIVSDLRLNDGTGIEILKAVKKQELDVPLILVTGYATIESAVEAVKLGAFDYVEKPVNPDKLRNLARNALRLKALEEENRELKGFRFGITTRNSEVLKVLDLVEKIAASDLPVLVTGETGTGKELIARAIHEKSPRSRGRFFAVNCGAIPANLLESELFGHTRNAFTGAGEGRKGLFEAAHGSSVFLDEVGTMPHDLQSKLLRTLQEGTIRKLGTNDEMKVDVRVVSATAEDLEVSMQSGRFRKDLFYRLNAVRIHLPPLRDRKDDIYMLCQKFLEEISARLGKKMCLSNETLNILLNYDWPGNIRELKNLIERASVVCRNEEILPSDLPEPLSSMSQNPNPLLSGLDYSTQFSIMQDRFDRQIIPKALRLADGNMGQAAKALNISIRNLQYKVKRLNIRK